MSIETAIIGRYFFYSALGLGGLSLLLVVVKRSRLALYSQFGALAAALVFFGVRGYVKEFIPFVDKVESFSLVFSLLLIYIILYRESLHRLEAAAGVVLALAAGVIAMSFADNIRYPSHYLLTIWFPLHTPLSFMAYALWILTAIKATSLQIKRSEDAEELNWIASRNRLAFIFFTLSMICGGIWGHIAWGGTFLWDPKIVWSLILWLFYANLLHIDKLPRFRPLRLRLNSLGFVILLITFIGTSFFSRSIHSF